MAQEHNEIDVRVWCIRILKNWYWFVICGVLFGGLGLLKYFSSNTQYRVESNIMIRSTDTDNQMPQMELLQMMGMNGTKKIDDEIAIFTSRDHITQIIKELDLQTEYRKKEGLRWIGQYPKHDITVEFPPTYQDTLRRSVQIDVKVRKSDYMVKVRYGKWKHSRHKVNDLTQPIVTCAGTIRLTMHKEPEKGDHYRISTTPLLPRVNGYKSEITATPLKKESNVICISATTDMPGRAIDFINKEIELYNMDAVVDKNIMASNTAAFIEERLRLIESELSSAEADVERYKEKNGIIDLSSEARLYLSESTEYRKRAAEIETQLNLIQYISDFVSDGTKQNSLIPANLGISDESLVTLITEYNEMLLQRMRIQRTAAGDNPVVNQMNTQLALLRENVITSIGNVRSSLKISQKDLERRYDKAQMQKYGVPSQERQFVEVERQRQLKESLYLFLYEKREENALTLASAVMPAKVIATPQMDPSPVAPRLKMTLLICLLLALCFPIGGMCLYDLLNNKLPDDSKELEKRLQVPFGGMLVLNHRGEHIAVREGENSVSAELFRSLRTNLRFMLPTTVQKPVILVTSSINGEGKSYVASNLATSLALLGKHVALVGLDIRKPMLAEYFGLNQAGCLTSYLSDTDYTVDDVVVDSGTPGLDLIPAGIIPPNPSELLQSDRLDQLFAELRARYDYVVVDSAPVAMVSDTFLLSRLCDMTIYVSRAHYTTWDLIDFLNQAHEQQRLPNIVSVLNGVKADKVGYGYGYGYGYDAKSKKKR